jgi:hypothetical protein
MQDKSTVESLLTSLSPRVKLRRIYTSGRVQSGTTHFLMAGRSGLRHGMVATLMTPTQPVKLYQVAYLSLLMHEVACLQDVELNPLCRLPDGSGVTFGGPPGPIQTPPNNIGQLEGLVSNDRVYIGWDWAGRAALKAGEGQHDHALIGGWLEIVSQNIDALMEGCGEVNDV